MSDFDVTAGIKHVNAVLTELGFTPRDADGNDYQRGSDNHIRFKTGGVHGEVTAQVFVDNKRMPALRFLNDHQIDTSEEVIKAVIAKHADPVIEDDALDPVNQGRGGNGGGW